MSTSNSSDSDSLFSPIMAWWRVIRPGVFGVLLVTTLTLVLAFDVFQTPQFALQVGDLAPEDILSPRGVTYVSDVLTERARQEAVSSVRDVYDPPDMRVARSQVSRTRLILDYIETVRADTLAEPERQLAYLAAIPDLELDQDTANDVLLLTAIQWDIVRENVLTVVDQAMREQIRDDRLEDAKLSIIPRLVRLELPEREAGIITVLAQQLIVPNSTANPQLTEQYRQDAFDAVEAVQQSFDINSTIVHEGEIIDEADIEAMQQLGLMQAETDWRDTISLLIAVILIVALLGLYIQRYHPEFFTSGRHMALISAMLILYALAARLMIPGRAILAFLYPSAGLAMLLTVLFDANLAIAITIALAAIVGFIGGNSLELTVYTAVGGIIASLIIRKSARLSTIFRTGIIVGVANISVILIYRLNNSDLLGIMQLIGASLINGSISAGFTLTGFYLVGNIFNVVTSIQLQELARLDHPLLQELLRQAPGTYHHSLMVSNLAEQAARRINADAALVRVGSFYHDVGKIARPYFFTENQDGANAHSRLDPLTSAETIANHVKDGLELAKKYHLPEKIRAFIPEHQGTRTIKFFYNQALKAASDPTLIDQADYRYPGPKPQSRETALVLLADACEAASTAMQSRSEQEVEQLVKKIVNEIMLEGELDESGLTLGDIHVIKASFAESLQGRFHVRPKYPGQRTSDQLPIVSPPEKIPAESAIETRPAKTTDEKLESLPVEEEE